ncbi:adenylate cyclase [Pseudotabrizicola sediminis]|uniref:Adenylate cyclase n=1 Tax=Pseudotabrizicola sediminis TaxID=2486418 RepID=A0ABY2KH66_9RHOB|nr:winged helix-turn-helix domain-containing protein [Pseudotabrizicola sediminis]TGD41620.1 adenylate cyclase [Pseudotabrizicola sediminis]TGD60987.1 tetratricopeptide repeat protein [Tabrizicola sp. WMC-M-20]
MIDFVQPGIELLRDLRRLRIDGSDQVIGARAFDVLAYLDAHSGRVVTKAELLEHVWADLNVEESNLTVQIAALRKLIGARAIATVPGVGYQLTLSAKPPAEPPKALPLPDKPSLVVLPFTNLMGSADRDYLVDGIVSAVITALSRVSSFFVISSTSSFTYKGRSVDLAEVGQELGVRYILEGSIQQAGDQMRIFTQLVEAATGHTLWQDRFDGRASEIFDLQDRVAEHVAGALEPKLILTEAARARAKPTDNLAAYDLCLRAAPLVWRQNALPQLEEGIELLRHALEMDPAYVYAKALICYAHTGAFATRWWSFERASEALPLAREVLDANPDDPLALAYAGHYLAYIGSAHREGLTALKRAAFLNPNSATVAMLLGWVHNYMSQNDAAIEQLQRAMRISPLHPHIGVMSAGIGNALLQKGDPQAAVTYYEQALTEYPEFATTQLGLMGCYWALGRVEDSARMADWFRAKVPDMTISTFRRTRPQENALFAETIVNALEANGFPP